MNFKDLLIPSNLFFRFVIDCLVTSFSLSRIRKISSKLGHYDTPNARSSHNDFVPTLGGIAFFVSLIVFFFFSNFYNINDTSLSIMLAITIMFFVGLTDDLKDLSPKVKFIGQLLALSVLIIQSDYRILSFHGFLGIYELNMFFSVFLSMFLILAFINAFNLIDGIDGMSSVTGIVISACFGFLFYKLQLFFFMFISVAVISMLLAFLRYNFSSKKKIFMGDTGSLVIGLVLGLLTLKLLTLETETFSSIAIYRKELPFLLLIILIVPAFDLFRVTFIRLKKRVSIFSPDRNHIHHLLIDSGLSHKKASLLSGGTNLFFAIAMYLSIQYLGLVFSFLFLVVFILACFVLFFLITNNRDNLRKKARLRHIFQSIANFF
jgi:UDP-N-acetylmuramyl pentapeptide phosphotransferase/UDP-N-acetylglucosamine-1-phosphate transferase